MSRWTRLPTDLAKLGVPTLASKAKFQIQVAHMNVLSSDPRIITGNDLAGNIEFFPNNYGPLNAAKVPNASDAVWDFGDQIVDPEDGYGSMQVHNFVAKQTIFAFNNWKAGPGADLGIGNSDLERQRRANPRLDLQRATLPNTSSSN